MLLRNVGAGRIDERVDASGRFCNRIDRLRATIVVPEVESDRPRLTAEITHRLGELGGRRFILAIGEGNVTAAGSELPNDRRPEPTASADHKRRAGAAGEVVGEVKAVFGHGRQPARSVGAMSRSPGFGTP